MTAVRFRHPFSGLFRVEHPFFAASSMHDMGIRPKSALVARIRPRLWWTIPMRMTLGYTSLTGGHSYVPHKCRPWVSDSRTSGPQTAIFLACCDAWGASSRFKCIQTIQQNQRLYRALFDNFLEGLVASGIRLFTLQWPFVSLCWCHILHTLQIRSNVCSHCEMNAPICVAS